MREIDMYHKMDGMHGRNHLFCFRKRHAFPCDESVSFCSSCGDKLQKTVDRNCSS